jgi:hypothetical protein
MIDRNAATHCRFYTATGLALVAVLAGPIGGGGAALAQQAPPAPAPNHAWGGCVIPQSIVDAIKGVLPSDFKKNDASFRVDYIVVRTVANPNGGEPLQGGGFSGPIVCRGPGIAITTTTETTLIPDDLTNPTPPGGTTSADIVGSQEDFILRYTFRPTGGTENRFCDGTAGFNDCFRLRVSP